MQTSTKPPLCLCWRHRWCLGQTAWAAALSLCLAPVPSVAAEPTPAIPTATVQASTVGVGYVLDGVVQAVQQSTMAAQASGRITQLAVRAGDRVRAGQLLARIDDREAQLGQQQTQAQLSQAEAELYRAQAQRDRTRNLQAQGFVSPAALETADAQYQSAAAQRAQALAATRQSGLAQGYTRVTSPLDGWVLQTLVQAGDLAVPGTPLAVVVAPQPLRVVVQVPASRAVAVRQAKTTAVLVDGLGSVRSITPLSRLQVPASDPVSQTTEWRLDLPAPDAAALLPGQQVRVRFGADSASQPVRLAIPAAAVVRRGELNAVYVATANAFALRAVRLGADLGPAGVEVLAGLRAGEVVATEPLRAAQASATPKP